MSQKKQQTEIITGTYIYDDIKLALMLGGTKAVHQFESLILALKDSMIRETFTPENYMCDYIVGSKTIRLNAAAGAYLHLMKNVLIDFGIHAKANISSKISKTNEGAIGVAINVRRFDILDDVNSMDGKNKSILHLYPQHLQTISAGSYSWVEKSWEGWFNPDKKLTLGLGGDVQVSPIIEETVRIYLWAITQAMETDYLYRRYAIIQQKLERAIRAAEEQITIYDTLIEDAIARQQKNKVKMTQLATATIIELRQIINFQKTVQTTNKMISAQLDDENSPINQFVNIIDRGEKILLELYKSADNNEKTGGFLKGQLVVLNRTINKIKNEFDKQNIPFETMDDRFGLINDVSWFTRLKTKIRSRFKHKEVE